jgi:hypothetical protein
MAQNTEELVTTLSQRVFEGMQVSEEARQADIAAANAAAQGRAHHLARQLIDVEQLPGADFELAFEIGVLYRLMPTILARKAVADGVETETGEKIPIGPIDYPGGIASIRHYTGALVIASQALERPIRAGSQERNILIEPDTDPEEAAMAYVSSLRQRSAATPSDQN